VGFPFVDCWVAPNQEIPDFQPILGKEQLCIKSTKENQFISSVPGLYIPDMGRNQCIIFHDFPSIMIAI